MNNEENKIKFIEKGKEKYKNQFDYSNVEYVNSKTKINIICNRCQNNFLITPSNFLQYIQPCPICRKETGRNKKDNYSEFNNSQILQYDKNLNFIKKYQNINEIIETTGINKIKKADIKRCCLLNHNKINKQMDKIKYSISCDNIWFFDCDKDKIK